MIKKLQTKEILEMVSKPDFAVRYMLSPNLQNKEVLACDYNGEHSVIHLGAHSFMNNKILEIFIHYKGKTIYRIARPNAKWHRPVVNDMLKIYNALKSKVEENQK